MSKTHNYKDSEGNNHEVFQHTDGEGGWSYTPVTEDNSGVYGMSSESLQGAQQIIEDNIKSSN